MEVFEWRQAPKADFAVIGDPVAHSLSPRMHSAAFQHLDLPYRYVALSVTTAEVSLALDNLLEQGYIGVNVTVPHKQGVLDWLDQIEPFAARAQSVNCIRLQNYSGINTDAPGFLDTLRDLGLIDGRALVLGAGGSSRALCLALMGAGFEVAVWNRTPAKSISLALEIGASFAEEPDPEGCRIVVNATSSSIGGDPLPVQWANAPGDCIAYDLFYARGGTPFMHAAEEYRLKTVDGLPLLVAQGARSLEYWLDVKAPREIMLDAIQAW